MPADGERVLGYLARQDFAAVLLAGAHGLGRAYADAAPAALADIIIDVRARIDRDRAVRTVFRTDAASYADVAVHGGLFGLVHLGLAAGRSAAHAEVLERAAESRRLVTLEVRQRDQHVGIHDCAANLGVADVFAVDGHEHVVVALESVGDDGLASQAQGIKSVLIGDVQMIQRVLARADIERGTVGHEGSSAELLDEVGHRARIVCAQEGKVARFAEVHLDRGELVLKIDLFNARRAAETNQLVADVFIADGAHGGKINFGFAHDDILPVRYSQLNSLIVHYITKSHLFAIFAQPHILRDLTFAGFGQIWYDIVWMNESIASERMDQMKKLIVAEKPSVGRDIARVLGVRSNGDGYLYGDDYVVTWAVGHLVTLCEPGECDERYQKWRMDTLPMLPDRIPLKVIPATKKQFNTIKKLMNSAKIASVICATDSAREGELIFRYIYQMAGCTKPVERLWISSMTDAAIKQGFANLKPASEYDALYESAKCRSEADWLVGMNASRAFSLRYDAHLSVGRVQTPTLSLIVRRDREIRQFVPEEYWEVRANFGDYQGLWINPAPPKAQPGDKKPSETRIFDKKIAEQVRDSVKGQPARVSESSVDRKHYQPPQLFDLTSLQREANRKLSFSADRTLKIAQSLYETHKLITYPRTDSRYLPDDMQPKVKKVLANLPEPYAAFVRDDRMNRDTYSRRYYDNGKISDHHAIVPTEKRANLSSLKPDEQKLYDMIVRRLIAMHYPDYVFDSARVITSVGEHRFKSTGVMPVCEGWRAVYQDDSGDSKDPPLPTLQVGDARKVEHVNIKSAKTKAPAAHTDASILKLMENAGQDIEDETLREKMKSSGLGTPATRAAIIERLIQVGYARRSGKSIVSTEKGQNLIDVVPDQIASAVTTGKWEKALSEMAACQDETLRIAKSARFMSGIRRFSEFLVTSAKEAPASVHFEREAQKVHTKKR